MRWEYKKLTNPWCEEELNRLGDMGWELVSAYPIISARDYMASSSTPMFSCSAVFVFKRQVKEEP